jgi:glycosyltransferase involved in cell wall biosynthesis
LATIAPAVSLKEQNRDRANVPEGQRFILCVGRLERSKGFHDAIWAYDILRYVHPDVHLVIVGEGPERERLEQFRVNANMMESLWLPGELSDVSALMRRAELVWSPGQVDTGRQVVLEAMAAGKPVIASRFPGLAELIVEGETGVLVPAEDQPMLARATHQLLRDPDLRTRMGAAARRRAAEQHRPEVLAECCAVMYKGG